MDVAPFPVAATRAWARRHLRVCRRNTAILFAVYLSSQDIAVEGEARRTDCAVQKALDATVSLRSQPELKVGSSKLSYLPNHMAVLTLPKCEGINGHPRPALLATRR